MTQRSTGRHKLSRSGSKYERMLEWLDGVEINAAINFWLLFSQFQLFILLGLTALYRGGEVINRIRSGDIAPQHGKQFERSILSPL